MRKPSFVPASELYDVSSGMLIAHPAHRATGAEVREALENGDESRERRVLERY
ncbi:hypothetical protein [Natrarchaeobius halalkaliphilus]|uniref:hypothetical protein n=1 Tax=Natrarchaeobius halalkaliphilus TaxID=1679091 RepID=UPI0014046B30|nr:hypothetical protein [Natrarchaeobius halalkaliphilus]